MAQIYFLEWLAKESGFSESALLKQMLSYYQKWDPRSSQFIKHILKFCKFDWLGYAFSWRESYLNNNYDFWLNIDDKWRKLLKEISSEEYKNIKFSKKPINEYLNKNKTKILKLKRL
jgi:hypothetical protein